MNAGTFVRTVRGLTPRQALWRILDPLRWRLYAAAPGVARVRAREGAVTRDGATDRFRQWLELKYPGGPTEGQAATAARVASGSFAFVGEARDLGGPPIDWTPSGASRLWLYHLHYLEWLPAMLLAGREAAAAALLGDWAPRNPAPARPAWEPYVASTRTVALAAASALAPEIVPWPRILAEHAAWVDRHVEHHVGGNHLIRNAKALIVGAAGVAGSEAEGWERHGRSLLRAELRRQILPDGGHDERAPMYHAAVLEDVLDVLAILGRDDRDRAAWAAAAGSMVRWLRAMLHPDGSLARFGDTVARIDPPVAALLGYAERVLGRADATPPAEVVALRASGFYVLSSGDARAIVSCGDVGAPSFPAHAHADTLSFELAWHGTPLVVDTGVAGYAEDDLRRYVRSTAAHNTVVVDGADQSEMWRSHRVGRRARPLEAVAGRIEGWVRFSGSHDGYRGRGVVHRRHVLARGRCWLVVDELRARGAHEYESLLHLHPGARARIVDGVAEVDAPGGAVRVRRLGSADLAVVEGRYCEDWGRDVANDVVRLVLRASGDGVLGFAIVPADTRVEARAALAARGVTVTGSIDGEPFDLRVA